MDNEQHHPSPSERMLDYIPQRRIGVFDHLRPQRWNWYLVRRPMDRALVRQAPAPLTISQRRGLRFFWLDGIFAAIFRNDPFHGDACVNDQCFFHRSSRPSRWRSSDGVCLREAVSCRSSSARSSKEGSGSLSRT